MYFIYYTYYIYNHIYMSIYVCILCLTGGHERTIYHKS